MSLISLMGFSFAFMTSDVKLYSPLSPRQGVVISSGIEQLSVPSHIHLGTQLPGNRIAVLLIHERFPVRHPVFPSDILCSPSIRCSPLLSGFSAQNDFQAVWSSSGSYFHFELLPHGDACTCLFILQTHLLLLIYW